MLGAHLRLVETLLAEQRVGHRHQKEIEREALQGPVSTTCVEFAQPACNALVRAVEARVEVVDQQRLDAI